MITHKKIKGYDVELPQKGAFTIETDKDFIKLHTLTILSGKRGGGKSVAVANLVKKAKQKGYFDRVFLVSPTYESNKLIWDIAGIEEEDVYEPTVDVLFKIQDMVQAEKEEWENFVAEKELFKQYKKDMKTKHTINQVDDERMIMYYDLGFMDMKSIPKWKYKNEVPPRLAVIIDDAMGTDLMNKRTAGLTNFCIKHRHIGDGLGISVFMLVQSYCANGGIARPIRENTTNLFLFKINDEKQIAKVKEECDLPVTDEEWNQLCSTAHEKQFNFLMIDFSSKCKAKMFRNGFSEYMIPKSLEDKCMCPKK